MQKKIVLVHGLIAGAILSAMMLATLPFLDRIGFDRGAVIGYSTMVAAFLLVYFGVRSYRDQIGDGRIGFGRAFLVGLAITAVATVCYVATWQFVYRQITPDFVDKYAAYAIDKKRKAGASELEVAATAKEMVEFKRMYENPFVNVALTALEPLPVGLLFTLVSAALLSRKRRPQASSL